MAATDATQQRLLQAAGEVFAEKGFQAATVREICARAEVSNIAAINYYFGDKEKLYAQTLREAVQCRMNEAPPPAWPPGTPPNVKLHRFIHMLVERVVITPQQTPRWYMQLMLRELSDPSPAGKSLVREFIRPVYESLWAILRDVLPPDVSQEKLHLTAFSVVGQCMYHRLGRPVIRLLVGEDEHDSYSAEVLAEHITAFTLRALGLPALAATDVAQAQEASP
jgi:AcrR family transcriptional regulator